MTEKIKIIGNLWLLPTVEGYKIGLTNEAQEELGAITFAMMPKIGQLVNKGDSLIEVEAEKAVTEFSTPLSGKIVSINEKVEKDPSILDNSNQLHAWIAVLADIDERELEEL